MSETRTLEERISFLEMELALLKRFSAPGGRDTRLVLADIVSKEFGFDSMRQIGSDNRDAHVCEARKAYCWLAEKTAGMSRKEIARIINRTANAISYCISENADRMQTDRLWKGRIERLQGVFSEAMK